MADKVAIDLLINASNSAKSVKDLKQSIKDLKNAALEAGEGSKDFARLTSAASQAKDQMDDLNDAIHALNPENLGQSFAKVGSTIAGGFQAAQGAMALFGSESEDVEKALLKVQAATAFAQGIQSVGDLGKAFKALNLIIRANPIGAVVTAVLALGAAVAILYDKYFRAKTGSELLTEQLEKQKKANEILVSSIDNEITALTGLASNEEKIIELKRKKLLITIQEAKASLEIAKAKQKESLESAKEVTMLEKVVSLFTYQNAQVHSIISASEDYSKATEEATTATQNLGKALAELSQLENTEKQKSIDKQKERNEELQKILALNGDFEVKKLTSLSQAKIEIKQAEDLQLKAIETGAEERQKEDLARFEAYEKARVSIRQNAFAGLSALGEIFINDSKKLEKFNKATALAQIAVDTAKAISALVAASNANPLNAPTFGAAGIAQFSTGIVQILANIAKAKQILSSGGSGSAPSLGGSARAGGGTSSQQGVDIKPLRSTVSTEIDSRGVEAGKSVVRAYVVESDITSTQKTINNIVKKSKI